MKWVERVLTLVIGLILHTTLAAKWQILGISPDVFAAFVVCLACLDGAGAGALVGALGGMYLDVLYLYPGYYTIAYLIAGALGGLIAERSRISKWISSGIVIFSFSLIKQFLTFFIVFLLGGTLGLLGTAGDILVSAVYTTVLFYVVYGIAMLIHRIPFIQRHLHKEDWDFS